MWFSPNLIAFIIQFDGPRSKLSGVFDLSPVRWDSDFLIMFGSS